MKKTFAIDKPEISNSEQGCQFTNTKYTDYHKEHDTKTSMVGKKRWVDNSMMERWIRTFKYDEFFNDYTNIQGAGK